MICLFQFLVYGNNKVSYHPHFLKGCEGISISSGGNDAENIYQTVTDIYERSYLPNEDRFGENYEFEEQHKLRLNRPGFLFGANRFVDKIFEFEESLKFNRREYD